MGKKFIRRLSERIIIASTLSSPSPGDGVLNAECDDDHCNASSRSLLQKALNVHSRVHGISFAHISALGHCLWSGPLDNYKNTSEDCEVSDGRGSGPRGSVEGKTHDVEK